MPSVLMTDPGLGEDGVFDLSRGLPGTHESVKIFRDKSTGLRAILALHSTTRGLALGGTRFYAGLTVTEMLRIAAERERSKTPAAAADVWVRNQLSQGIKG